MNKIDIAKELIAAGRKVLTDLGGDPEEVNACADWLIAGLPFRPQQTPPKLDNAPVVERRVFVCQGIAAQLRQLKVQAGSISHHANEIEALAKQLDDLMILEMSTV